MWYLILLCSLCQNPVTLAGGFMLADACLTEGRRVLPGLDRLYGRDPNYELSCIYRTRTKGRI